MNEDALMQSICRQVNRNWTPGDNIVRTIDTFWLPGTDLMKSAPLDKYLLIDKLPDSINGLCEEKELNKHMAHPSINGYTGAWGESIWVRSASSEQYYYAVWMDSSNIYYGSVFGNSDYFFGFSPACSIG